MEEREARANRFVFLLAGDTVSEVPLKPSNVVPLLPHRVARLHRQVEEAFLPGALELPLEALLGQPNDPTNPTQQGPHRTPS